MTELRNDQNFGAASAIGTEADCHGCDWVWIQVVANATAAFTGGTQIQLYGGIHSTNSVMQPIDGSKLLAEDDAIMTPSAGMTFTKASGTAIIGIATLTLFPQSSITIRIAKPPRIIQPVFTYGAGGGTNPTVAFRLYGWMRRT